MYVYVYVCMCARNDIRVMSRIAMVQPACINPNVSIDHSESKTHRYAKQSQSSSTHRVNPASQPASQIVSQLTGQS